MDQTIDFAWVDILVVVSYLGLLVGIGIYFSRRQRNIETYFLGDRSIGWIPVGMSLMAALNSGIDYLGGPFSVFEYGTMFMLGMGSWFLLYPWAAHVTLPFYRRLNMISAYEYLEHRFNSPVRTLAACIFLCWRLGWMATALYVPALAISITTGWPLLPTTLALGLFVTLYTMLGGITGVIWTDVIQFCVMLTGVLATLIVALNHVPGGIAGVWNYAEEQGRVFLIYPTPAEVDTLWERIVYHTTDYRSIVGLILATMVGRMTTYTCEQSMVQRFQATRSLNDARAAFVVNALGDILWTVGLGFVGLALYAYFKGALPAGVREDSLTIYFMREVFPSGLNGLVVAAVLASGLSAIDAAINACTSVIMSDFYNRLWLKRVATAEMSPEESRHQLRISRIVTVLFAIVGIVLSANVHRLGNIIEIASRAIQTFTGPLLGLFIVGMFSRRIHGNGVTVGGTIGLVVAVYVAFFTDIGFIWPTVFGFAATCLFSYAFSMIMPGRATDEQLALTWRQIMRRPVIEQQAAAVASAHVG